MGLVLQNLSPKLFFRTAWIVIYDTFLALMLLQTIYQFTNQFVHVQVDKGGPINIARFSQCRYSATTYIPRDRLISHARRRHADNLFRTLSFKNQSEF